MEIIARYPGRCFVCGIEIVPGMSIDYENREVRCLNCIGKSV